ncbi:MAG TPA: hypothetical protein VK615_06475, partial [Candidatus Binatia bacterium]|nr:hypothetical protein [Candidatus Binatia bacterium]
QKQRDAEMAQVLTPTELEEYQLRNSPTAASLRAQLHGFNPSEEEFRKLFQMQKTFDDQFNNGFNVTDPNQTDVQAAARDQAQQALESEMRKALGSQRYAEYQRVQDPDYPPLRQLMERFDASPSLAGKVIDMKLEAERQKLRLEANPNLTPDQRAQALARIRDATEQSVAQTMGGLWQAYQKSGSQWIQNLGESDYVPEPAPEQPTQVIPAPFPFPLAFPPPPVPPVTR